MGLTRIARAELKGFNAGIDYADKIAQHGYGERIASALERIADVFEKEYEAAHAQDAPFCDQCAGPFKDHEQYGGHWDTCPNRDDPHDWMRGRAEYNREHAAELWPGDLFYVANRDYWYDVDGDVVVFTPYGYRKEKDMPDAPQE